MIHLAPRKKIPNTFASYSEDYLQARTQTKNILPDFRAPFSYTPGPSSRATELALLKYYPKYCRSLRFDKTFKPWSVLARIKQIKILENIQYSYERHDEKVVLKKLLKKLLRNKRKSLRSLPLIKSEDSRGFIMTETFTFPEMCSFFPNLQSLKIFRSPSFDHKPENVLATRPLEKEMQRFYGYFWGNLRFLQHLEISYGSENIWVILPWLDSCKRFLTSLKAFSLEIDIDYRPQQRNYPRAIFQTLLRHQDLLKYVTHLKFSGIQIFSQYGSLVKSVLDSCSNLVSLTFPVNQEFSRADRKHLTLAPLQSLQNVKILTLDVNDLWGFFEAFEFPIALQKLVLQLGNKYAWLGLWKTCFDSDVEDDKAAFQSYEKYQTLLSFFERFKHLKFLTCLHLSMPLFAHANELMNNLILPLIRATAKLENFECQFSHSDLEMVSNDFDLSVFLNGIAPLGNLKSFKISQRFHRERRLALVGDLVMTFSSLKSYYFPEITSVKIDNWISEDFNLKQFFKMFSNNLKEVALSKIYLYSIHSFVHILETLVHVGQQSTAKIKVTTFLYLQDPAALDHLKCPVNPPKNVTVNAEIEVPSSEQFVRNLRTLKILQEAPSNLKIHIRTVRSTVSY